MEDRMHEEFNLPVMVPAKQAAAVSGISYHRILEWCSSGKIVSVKAGCHYLVNMDAFREFLNGKQSEERMGKEND